MKPDIGMGQPPRRRPRTAARGPSHAGSPAAPGQALSLTIYVAHHPASDLASGLRPKIYRHYRRDPRRNLGEGGLGLEVEYRSEPSVPNQFPIPVDFSGSQATAVVAILDRAAAADADLVGYIDRLAAKARPLYPRAIFLPVVVDEEGRRASRSGAIAGWQGLDATAWDEREFGRRLFTQVDQQLSALLAAYLAGKADPSLPVAALRRAAAERAQIFLSHSKHDPFGEPIASALRAELVAMNAGAFFDVVSIPPGTPWEEFLDDAAGSHALLVTLTDSYSSRTYCRKEVLAAKRRGMPIVVADCLEDADDRSFPYLGNVPVVRMAPDARDRLPFVIGRLFDEILRSLVWRCHTDGAGADGVRFLPRAPELISLAYLERKLKAAPEPVTVVYPGVPLSAEEAELFQVVAPHVKLSPFVTWKAGIGN